MPRRLILFGGLGALIVALAVYGAKLRLIGRTGMFGGRPVPEERTRAAARELAALSALDRERARLEIARLRLAVERRLATPPAGDTFTVAVMIPAEEWNGPTRAGLLEGEIRSAWTDLGLSTTKVAVGVVVADRATMRQWGRALAIGPTDPAVIYIPPDSLTPTTCLAVVAAPRGGREAEARALRTAAAAWLGPCAYYARFGVPGPRMRRWLANRRADVVMLPDWVEGGRRSGPLLPWLALSGRMRGWYWTRQYLVPPYTAGCSAGRAAACVEALRAGDREPRIAPPAMIVRSDLRWISGEHLLGGEYFLGAVLRASGPTKFRELWRTTLPIDSALTLALGAPAGEWTAQWEAGVATPPRFGPAPRPIDAGTALLLAMIAIAVTARSVRRREVR